MNTPTQDIIFRDIQCASVTVPSDCVALYVTIKAEQLAALNDLLNDATAGFEISLSERAITTFTGLANELAHITKELVVRITEEARNGKAGA